MDGARGREAAGRVQVGQVLHAAVVTDARDPDGRGRVRVRVQGVGDELELWARVSGAGAGRRAGALVLPRVDDEVVVAFAGGDLRRPLVLGSLWSERNQPPESAAPGDWVVEHPGGTRIAVSEAQGRSSLRLTTPEGDSVEVAENGTVAVTAASGDAVHIGPAGITLTAVGKLTLTASQVEIDAGSVTVNAGQLACHGTIKADTVVATTVVASSYTPGAGNIW